MLRLLNDACSTVVGLIPISTEEVFSTNMSFIGQLLVAMELELLTLNRLGELSYFMLKFYEN